MKKTTVTLIVCAVLVAAAAVFGLSRLISGKQSAPAEKSKTFTVTVVSSDGSSKDTEITTKKSTLSAALYEKGMLSEKEYKAGGGKYTVVNGVTADYDRDAAWWCVTKDGKFCDKGMDELKIADGDHYELTYTVG